MTKKYLQLLTLSLIVALSLTLAGMALAQTWQEPKDTTPPGCTAEDDGCYVPINVSSKTQNKAGWMTFSQGIGLNGNTLVKDSKFIKFGSEALSALSSRIAWKSSNKNALDIYGAGTTIGSRLVAVWDNLWVDGDIRARRYYICTDGSCNEFTGGGGDSLWENIAGTAKVVLKTLPTPGRVMVGIGNNNPTVDLEVGSPTHTTSAYVGVRSALDKYAGFRWATGDKNIWWMYKPANNNTEGVPAESLVLGNTASGGNVATPKVVFTSGASGHVMEVKGSAKATNLTSNTLVVLNPSPVNTNTGITLGNSPVTEDHVLYVEGSPAGGSTKRDVFLKPVSQIGGGVLSQFWTKISNQEEITYSGKIGIAGAMDPNTSVDLAIGSNSSGLKADSGNISIVTNGSKNLTVATSANRDFNVGVGTRNSRALSVNGLGVFDDGVSLGGNSVVSSGKDIKFYNTNNNVFGRVLGTDSSLSLVGVGTSPNRLIRLYDTASTTNLIARNICTAPGSCTSVSNIVNNTTGFWTEADNRTGLFYPGSIGLKGAENPNSNLAVAIRNNITGLGSSVNNVLDFWTNGRVRLSISSDGKVQIPTNGQLCFGSDCKTSWPVAGVSGWGVSGNNIYNTNTGNVGIGNNNPQSKLQVSGEIRANNFFVNDLADPNSGIVRARNVTVGTGGITLGGVNRTSWPTTPERIFCSFGSDGARTTGVCSDADVRDAGENRNYTLNCPSSHPNVISGGAWCNSGDGQISMLRLSAPNSQSSWMVSCVRQPSYSAPIAVGVVANQGKKINISGASLICSK